MTAPPRGSDHRRLRLRPAALCRARRPLVLIGYEIDAELERRCGIEVDPETAVPSFDPESCETNVPGLYVAGTLQAGQDLGKIFIENSRGHGVRIVRHLRRQLAAADAVPG